MPVPLIVSSEGFARRLRAALAAMGGVPQARLAEAAGVSAAAVSFWVAGLTDPAKIEAGNLIRAAQFLGVSVEDLLLARERMPAGGAHGRNAQGAIISWNSADALPDGDFAVIPRYVEADADAAAGAGVAGYQMGQPFRTDFLKRMEWSPRTHFVLSAVGDAMVPTIPEGAQVVIDTRQLPLKPGAIYAVQLSSLELRRVTPLPNGQWRVYCDNPSPAYASFDVNPAELRVVGRAVHVSTAV